LKKVNGRYELYGNPITKAQSRAADGWKTMLAKKFSYNPNEKYSLSTKPNPFLGDVFGLMDLCVGHQYYTNGLWPLSDCDGWRICG